MSGSPPADPPLSLRRTSSKWDTGIDCLGHLREFIQWDLWIAENHARATPGCGLYGGEDGGYCYGSEDFVSLGRAGEKHYIKPLFSFLPKFLGDQIWLTLLSLSLTIIPPLLGKQYILSDKVN